MHPGASPLAGLAGLASPSTKPVPLDDIDLALLQLLAVDARRSRRSLASALGMSAPATGERIARLERTGVIRGYNVVVNWEAAGFPVVVYLAITSAQGFDLGPVMMEVSQLPEVESLDVVTGELDLLARVRVRDHDHLRSLLLEKIWQIEGVQRTETYMSITESPPKNLLLELVGSVLAKHHDDSPGVPSSEEKTQ